MNTEITCPECGTKFKLTEKDYNSIAKQVRDKTFESELQAFKENELSKIQALNVSKISNITIEYERQLRVAKDEYNALLEYRNNLNTKALGEDFEQYCLNKFEEIRFVAFPRCYFEKDNASVKEYSDDKKGSKGDFIFRDYDEKGNEIISIMFEMKNQSESGTKKNDSFYQKLDKDRRLKNCDYAVLVSNLEPNNEVFNHGITDISYKYPKMYVVRPEFFITIIGILRNAELNNVDYINEINSLKNKNDALDKFEENLDDFKLDFNKSYKDVESNYENMISNIDQAIKSLEETKKNIENYHKKVKAADNKLKNLTVKKLVNNNPVVEEMLDK